MCFETKRETKHRFAPHNTQFDQKAARREWGRVGRGMGVQWVHIVHTAHSKSNTKLLKKMSLLFITVSYFAFYSLQFALESFKLCVAWRGVAWYGVSFCVSTSSTLYFFFPDDIYSVIVFPLPFHSRHVRCKLFALNWICLLFGACAAVQPLTTVRCQ